MIIEFLLDMLKTVLLFLLGLLPTVEASFEVSGFIPWFVNILGTVAYFLPVHDFLAMFLIYLLIQNFNLTWKLLQRIWDALPFT